MDENITPLFIEIMGELFDPATGNTYATPTRVSARTRSAIRTKNKNARRELPTKAPGRSK